MLIELKEIITNTKQTIGIHEYFLNIKILFPITCKISYSAKHYTYYIHGLLFHDIALMTSRVSYSTIYYTYHTQGLLFHDILYLSHARSPIPWHFIPITRMVSYSTAYYTHHTHGIVFSNTIYLSRPCLVFHALQNFLVVLSYFWCYDTIDVRQFS
jgi:hypothetical protein